MTPGMTVAEWHGRWLDLFPRDAASSNTRLYGGALKFASEFRALPISAVDKEAVLRWMSNSPENRANARWVRSMFHDAVKAGLIDVCPFDGLPVAINRGSGPKVVLDEHDVDRLRSEALALWDASKYGRHVSLAIAVSAYAGLRIGELCALTRDDVDLEARELRVPPFKGRPERIAVVPDVIAPQLRQQFGVLYGAPSDQPFFVDQDVRPLTPPKLRQLWYPVREAAGLPECRWHDLRHHAVTWLLERADPIAVAFQIHGHANPATVLSLYNSPSPKRARDRLRRLV